MSHQHLAVYISAHELSDLTILYCSIHRTKKVQCSWQGTYNSPTYNGSHKPCCLALYVEKAPGTNKEKATRYVYHQVLQLTLTRAMHLGLGGHMIFTFKQIRWIQLR
jgi:hypothetical protein